MSITIEIKEEDKPKKRNGLALAMQRRGRGRHARGGKMRDRRMRRAQDARKSWRREWD